MKHVNGKRDAPSLSLLRKRLRLAEFVLPLGPMLHGM